MIKKIYNKKSGLIAQATLELTASLIGVMIIICATIAIFTWLNNSLVYRQKAYEETRAKAGNYTTFNEVQVDESDLNKFPKLNVFGE